MDFSVVVPVYNEEESLEVLVREVEKVKDELQGEFELILVDDYSDDQTPDILRELKSEKDWIRVLMLNQRSGQTSAMRQGLDLAQGEIAFTLDADLQNDPADIPRLVKKMQKTGADCVCGWRRSRQDTWLKAILSKSGNVLQRLFTGLKIHDVSCTLRAYKKHCVPKVPLNWEGQHRFIPLCLSLQGFHIEEIESNHRLRKFGYSKYTHKRIFRVIIDFFRILKSRGAK